MAGLDGFEARWQQEVTEVVTGIKEWRLQHPRATFRQIEVALDEKLNAMRARLLGELALASRAADQSGQPDAERAHCPGCGAQLAPRGKHARAILTQGGQAVRLERDYAVCPACGAGLFPPR